MENYEQGNRRVALRYLRRKRLFREDLPKEDRGYFSYAGLTMEKMACIFSWIMSSCPNCGKGLDRQNPMNQKPEK